MRNSSPSSHLKLLTTGDFSWKLSDEINPYKISISEQTREFHRFLNNFTKAKIFTPATPDQYWHLIRNLQCTIKSYDKYVLSLQSEIKELYKAIKQLKTIHKKKLDDIYAKNLEKYLCPICLEPQSTLVDLDFHISKKHNEVYDKWNYLRCEGIKKYMSKNVNKEDENQNPNSINELHDWMNDKFNYLERLIYEKKKEKKNEHHRQHKNDNNQTKKISIPNKIKSHNSRYNRSAIDSTESESDIHPFIKNNKPTFNIFGSSNDKNSFNKNEKPVSNLTGSSNEINSHHKSNEPAFNLTGSSTNIHSIHKDDKPIPNLTESSIGMHSNHKNDESPFTLTGNSNDIRSTQKNSKPTFNLTGSSNNLSLTFNSPNRKIIHSNEDLNQNNESSQESSDILSIPEDKKEDKGHFVEEIENNKNHSIFFSTTSLNKLKTKSEGVDN